MTASPPQRSTDTVLLAGRLPKVRTAAQRFWLAPLHDRTTVVIAGWLTRAIPDATTLLRRLSARLAVASGARPSARDVAASRAGSPIRAQGPGRGGGCQCVVMRAWSQAFSSGSSPVRDPLAASVHRFLAEELRYCRCDICGREVVR